MQKRSSIEEQLAQFLAKKSWLRNTWIANRFMKVYVRKGFHAVSPGEVVETLDLASIDVGKKHQRKGRWSTFLSYAEELVKKHDKIRHVFIENVINEHLAASLKRRGYYEFRGSYIKMFSPDAAPDESSTFSRKDVDPERAT